MKDDNTSQKRLAAIKCKIEDIQKGKYVQKEGWEPNYIEYNDKKISRANIIGIIIGKNEHENNSLIVDDKSGRIVVRNFEDEKKINALNIGDPVIVIGKIREYLNVKYIVPEIIKKIKNKKIIELRELELSTVEVKVKPTKIIETKSKEDDYEDIIKIIKKLDQGSGADFDEIIKSISGGEIALNNLLKQGEVFEIRPGKIKVLE